MKKKNPMCLSLSFPWKSQKHLQIDEPKILLQESGKKMEKFKYQIWQYVNYCF